MKRLFIGLFALVLTLSFAGCEVREVALGAFSEDGLSFYLPENAVPSESDSFDILYCTESVSFAAVKDEFQNYGERQDDVAALTEEQYAKLVQAELGASFQRDENGTFAAAYSEGGFFHYAAVIKGDSAFWVLTFSCPEDEAENHMADFLLWAAAARAE